MSRDIVIVFDCGATNVRAVATDSTGAILSSKSFPNNTSADPYYPSWRIWDVNEIWKKMTAAAKKVTGEIDKKRIAGVTVATFGVDGTIFSKEGEMLYPVISWQCERTVPIMENIGKYIPLQELYAVSGVLPFSFNTINKLIWFKEQRPDLIDKSHMFLFMPSIFSYFLSGEMVNDTTMAGTSMMTSLDKRDISDDIFARINIPGNLFGRPVEPGTVTGTVSARAMGETGIPEGTPVVATGHDTQFAIFGSGAEANEPVLSSGTWEILMVRASSHKTGADQLKHGITTELDSRKGLFNIGSQWIASGLLEWCRRNFFSDVKDNVYEYMISGAEKIGPGSNGVSVSPDFYGDRGGKGNGRITGLTMETKREEIYRAMLEALSARLVEGKKAIEKAGGFRAESILCVGGGSKNRLWNRLRADFTGVPLKIIEHKETTVLGASLFVQSAAGNASSPEAARSAVNYKTEIIEPRS